MSNNLIYRLESSRVYPIKRVNPREKSANSQIIEQSAQRLTVGEIILDGKMQRGALSRTN
jgi:hypothetical protein